MSSSNPQNFCVFLKNKRFFYQILYCYMNNLQKALDKREKLWYNINSVRTFARLSATQIQISQRGRISP